MKLILEADIRKTHILAKNTKKPHGKQYHLRATRKIKIIIITQILWIWLSNFLGKMLNILVMNFWLHTIQ